MTNFAQANMQGNVQGTDVSAEGVLGRMMMNDVRSYMDAVVFEADSDKKRDAVITSLSTTNLPIEVIEKISSLVANTTYLGKQFSDFSYDNGRASVFTVNVWVAKETCQKKVEVALMVSGASFNKSIVKAVEEVEEPVFDVVTKHYEAGWFHEAYTEVKKIPLTYDGKNQVVRKVSRPVFDEERMNPHEMDILREYLMKLSSLQALRNYAPQKIPRFVTEQRRLLLVPRMEEQAQKQHHGQAAHELQKNGEDQKKEDL